MGRMHLTNAQARRIALAAQGMGGDRTGTVGMRQVQSMIGRLGQFQIDAVNVLVRAQYMPLYSRLGPYDPSLLTRAAETPPRRLFEFWGHAASLIDVSLYPALRFRADSGTHQMWDMIRTLLTTQPEIIDQIEQAVATRGPATARELDLGEDRTRVSWGWNWSYAKTALEWLFRCGRVTVAGRNAQFERVYDIPARVIPPAVLEACRAWDEASPAERADLTHQAHVDLVRRAAQALGVGTARCLGDYFRTATTPTRAAIETLAGTGELIPVDVDGIKDPAWLWHGAARPRAIRTAALVSPFDSLVFERRRLASLFGTDYTIGLYTPKEQRTHGYYVYLFLLDDAFAARTDLKADRARGTLLVQSAWLEPGTTDRTRVATELAHALRRLATWLGLPAIAVANTGDLAPYLANVV